MSAGACTDHGQLNGDGAMHTANRLRYGSPFETGSTCCLWFVCRSRDQKSWRGRPGCHLARLRAPGGFLQGMRAAGRRLLTRSPTGWEDAAAFVVAAHGDRAGVRRLRLPRLWSYRAERWLRALWAWPGVWERWASCAERSRH